MKIIYCPDSTQDIFKRPGRWGLFLKKQNLGVGEFQENQLYQGYEYFLNKRK